MRVCVDTTIFLDILKDEFRDFQDKLYEALVRKEELVSPSVVYGELLPQFKGSTKQIDEFLNEHQVKIESLQNVPLHEKSINDLGFIHKTVQQTIQDIRTLTFEISPICGRP